MVKKIQDIDKKIFRKIYNYDIIKLPRGYDIFSIKPTKDINRGANIIYVLNACF